MYATLNEQMDVYRAGAIELLPEDELARKIENSIKKQKPLNIKLGADPSRPDLHLGHAVVLHKLRQFQDFGHNAILIIGDFTGMIGDPSGKSKTRPQLTIDETIANGRTYLEQATIILDKSKMIVKNNSEWLSKLNFSDVIHLAAKYTVAQLLERDDFSKRHKANLPISMHEFLYPLAQAYDSYAINSDVELGGSDQKFNLLVGREIQKAYGSEPQCILTMPLLEGTDGVEKMSKSLDNYIALNDTPRDMFGKAMSVPDNMITRYLQYAAMATIDEINAVQTGLADGSIHPRNAKVDMAKKIVTLYYGFEAGENALLEFERIFKNKDLPDKIDLLEIYIENSTIGIIDLLVAANLSPSKKEARRLIEQGGVSIDSQKVSDVFSVIDIYEKKLIKIGKRNFLYVQKKSE